MEFIDSLISIIGPIFTVILVITFIYIIITDLTKHYIKSNSFNVQNKQKTVVSLIKESPSKYKTNISSNCKKCNREVALIGDKIADGNITAFTKEKVKEVGFFCNKCKEIYCGACSLSSWLLTEGTGTIPAIPLCPWCGGRVDYGKPEHK